MTDGVTPNRRGECAGGQPEQSGHPAGRRTGCDRTTPAAAAMADSERSRQRIWEAAYGLHAASCAIPLPFPCQMPKFRCRAGLHWARKVMTKQRFLMQRR
jgi:hypothetical protein